MQGKAGDRAREHRTQMPRQVVLPAIEQVLQVQAGLGLTFDRQAPLEEERVGILAAAREIDEVLQRPADRHVRRPGRAAQPPGDDLETERKRDIVDAQAEALAGELVEACGQRLAAQQLVDGPLEQASLQRRGCVAQQASHHRNWIGHRNLPDLKCRHSCHARRGYRLISVNLPRGRGARR